VCIVSNKALRRNILRTLAKLGESGQQKLAKQPNEVNMSFFLTGVQFLTFSVMVSG
jgi:hypothetical protein